MKEFNDIDLVRLVTEREWDAIVAQVPNVNMNAGTWWTSTDNHDDTAVCVDDEGLKQNDDVHSIHGLRPLFAVSGMAVKGIERGDRVMIRGYACTVVDVGVCPHRIFAFADMPVLRFQGMPNRNEILQKLFLWSDADA